jgi:hypothetical protein
LLLHDLHRIFDTDIEAQMAAKLNGQTPSEPWLTETRGDEAGDRLRAAGRANE